jgi:predicted NBD/HSP70 family sugar kinase
MNWTMESPEEGAEPIRTGLDQRAMRRHNLGLVMRHIARQGVRSRAAIAKETGLNKATVWSLVGELIERGLLSESSPTNAGTVGRPSRGVRLAGDGIAGLGLEVAEHHLTACAVDLTGVVRYRTVVPHDNRDAAPDVVVAQLAVIAKEALHDLAAKRLTTVGVTVALPGLVDTARGVLFVGPDVGWSEVPFAEMLTQRLGPLGFPIRADNDANLGALAELWDGVGRHLVDFIYLYGEIGTGVGAGIVAGRKLFRGLSGFAGEIGHVRLSRRGPRCRCGSTGCLETLAGWDELIRLAGMSGHVPGKGRADAARKELIARARAGDPKTIRALAEVSRWLSMALTSAVNLLSPQAVVLGGHFAGLGEWLVPRLEHEMRANVLGSKWSRCRVLISALGSETVVRGAAISSLHLVLADPTVSSRALAGKGRP